MAVAIVSSSEGGAGFVKAQPIKQPKKQIKTGAARARSTRNGKFSGRKEVISSEDSGDFLEGNQCFLQVGGKYF
jgi:hypothetical protein